MNHQSIREGIDLINCALDMKRKVVGVRFLFDAEAFEHAPARALTARMPYCVMVKRATMGRSVKAVFDNFGCMASARALGIVALDDFFLSGRHYKRLGLYKDLAVSKQVRRNMTLCQHKAHGVMIAPLEDCGAEPDVVLMVLDAYKAMRLVQAYTHVHGYHTAFKVAGNQAICSECTAHPFENNTINLSLMCSGTRFMAGWKDDELGVGFAFNKFQDIVYGLRATLNLTEPDRKKRAIAARASAAGTKHVDIVYGHNYYQGHYLRQNGQPDKQQVPGKKN